MSLPLLSPDGTIRACMCQSAQTVAQLDSVDVLPEATCCACTLPWMPSGPGLAIVSRIESEHIDVADFSSMVHRLGGSHRRVSYMFLRDPFEHKDAINLIRGSMVLGDRVIVESPLTHEGPALVTLIKDISPHCVSFRVPVNVFEHRFQFPRLLGRVLLLAERGFQVVVIDECNAGNGLVREFVPRGIPVESQSLMACSE